MSLLKEYREAERQIAELQRRLQVLEQDGSLAREKEFEDKLRALMGEYGVDLLKLVNVLDPNYLKGEAAGKAAAAGGHKPRRERSEVTYHNPHTNEKVTVRSANHGTLKAWREEFGADVVATWKV